MVAPDLIAAWLHARSLARGLPLPVADSGGWRVDTGLTDEVRRYVFASNDHGLTGLGHSIEEPRVLLKLAATGAELMAHLPPCWALASESVVMTTTAPPVAAAVPPGYRPAIEASAGIVHVEILDPDGGIAASGLGRVVMAALGEHRRSGEREVLTATADGRALYTSLGWTVLSPWATAVIPATRAA